MIEEAYGKGQSALLIDNFDPRHDYLFAAVFIDNPPKADLTGLDVGEIEANCKS